VYVPIQLILLVIWIATGAHFPWFAFPLLGWGILLAVHVGLFADGYFALSVEEATKFVEQARQGPLGQRPGWAKLMAKVFSKDAPLLRLNDLKTESKVNQQIGYMMILQGTMTGVRNPRAHEHSYLDEPHNALEILALCNHVVRVIRKATRTGKRKRLTT
jgi:uncharacterized protein (TIGR02391 family)